MGRYYAMDRDKRWDRIQIAYEALLSGKGAATTTAAELVNTVKARYEAKETDEFLTPIIVDPKAIVKDDDSLVFINYRSDRMREIVEALGVKPPFTTEVTRKNLAIWQMTQYNADFKHLPIIFPPVVSNMCQHFTIPIPHKIVNGETCNIYRVWQMC
jgi:2,3-bisphosphoglycerate-independent phosphoglycerate mutase